MFGFAKAISCARLTARGQCGQVGVVNTCIVTGLSTVAIRWRLLVDRFDPEPPTSSTACTSEMNSYPAGVPRKRIFESRSAPEPRSEERRVGKECRCGGVVGHEEKNG